MHLYDHSKNINVPKFDWHRIAVEALERLKELEEVRYCPESGWYWTSNGESLGSDLDGDN